MHAFKVKLDLMLIGNKDDVLAVLRDIKLVAEEAECVNIEGQLKATGIPIPREIEEAMLQ